MPDAAVAFQKVAASPVSSERACAQIIFVAAESRCRSAATDLSMRKIMLGRFSEMGIEQGLAERHERRRRGHGGRMLGHRNQETTAIYAHLDDTALRDASAQAESVIARAMNYKAQPPPSPGGDRGEGCYNESSGMYATQWAGFVAQAANTPSAEIRKQERRNDTTEARSRGPASVPDHGYRRPHRRLRLRRC